MRRFAFVVVALAPIACTHDFGAFENGGEPTDGSPPNDQGVDETSVIDSGHDASATDSGVGTDTTTPPDTTPPPTDTTPPPDTTPPTDTKPPPTDTGPPCSDPGGMLFGGHCYFPITTTSTWSTAKTACESTSAHLVTITSAAEQAFVAAMDPTNQRWIGLSRPVAAPPTDPKSFVWVTAEAVSYTNWAPTEPNGSGECVRLRNTNDWGDQACTVTYDAICERE